MSDQFKFAPKTAVQYLGELHPLADCLGSPDGLSSMAPAVNYLQFRRIGSLEALLSFVRSYRADVLFPFEFPAIAQAYWHARRSEVRELIALDQHLSRQPALAPFAEASRCVGAFQLKRFRPLKDERVVQRYLRAVESGEAHGWHTLVYGLILSIYFLPLRQGLLEYATHTFNGFVRSSAGYLHLSEPELHAALTEIHAQSQAEIDAIVTRYTPSQMPGK